jgi:AAA domain
MEKKRLRIVTADERMRQTKGVKALIVGPAGVGKTSLLRTCHLPSTLFVDLEAGDLSIQDLHIDTMRPRTWTECRDLAVYLGGPNPALPPTAWYSQARYESVCRDMGMSGEEGLAKYDTYFIDSITVATRLCFQWAEQQPESFNDKNKKNLLATYGLLGREMIGWLTHLQHTRNKNVIFVGILENTKDEFNMSSWGLQAEGGKTGKELPGIVDQIATMQYVQFEGSDTPVRALVCQQPNRWNYPAKDRSGRLEMFEKPHLGEWIAKLTASSSQSALSDSEAA